MYAYGSPHMAAQKQGDQHERTFSSYVRIQDVVLKTYLGRWTIGRSGERGSGISVLPARYDDDDYIIPSNYSYLILIICLHTDIWFQVICYQLYGLKYSYLILIIFKQIYLTFRLTSNCYYHSEWKMIMVMKGWLSTPELDSHHRYPSWCVCVCGGYVTSLQIIQSAYSRLWWLVLENLVSMLAPPS